MSVTSVTVVTIDCSRTLQPSANRRACDDLGVTMSGRCDGCDDRLQPNPAQKRRGVTICDDRVTIFSGRSSQGKTVGRQQKFAGNHGGVTIVTIFPSLTLEKEKKGTKENTVTIVTDRHIVTDREAVLSPPGRRVCPPVRRSCASATDATPQTCPRAVTEKLQLTAAETSTSNAARACVCRAA